MSFKVANVFHMPEVDFGDELLQPLGQALVKAMSMTEESIIGSAADADAVIGVVSVQPFNRRLLESLPKCRIIAGIGIGYDKTDLEAASELGIAVTNVPDYCLDEVFGAGYSLHNGPRSPTVCHRQSGEAAADCFHHGQEGARRNSFSHVPDARSDSRYRGRRQDRHGHRFKGAGARHAGDRV